MVFTECFLLNYSKHFPAVVSGRVTARAKKLMDEYGFTVRDAVEWYLIYKVDHKRRIEMDKTLLKEEIKNLKLDLSIY